MASTPKGVWSVLPPERVSGNPTGAGDAMVGALTLGLVSGTGWPERLASAVALSAAAVHHPLAGSVDLAAYEAYLDRLVVQSA